MIGISWNCRGLGNHRTVLSICKLNKTHKPDFFILIETHAQATKVESLKQKIGYEAAFCVDSVGRAGGIAILWRKAENMSLLGFSQNHIDMELIESEGIRWRSRKITWNLLRTLSERSTLPWCCMGDFNDITCMEEKKGGAPHPAWLIRGFNEAVSDAQLQDLPLHGYP